MLNRDVKTEEPLVFVNDKGHTASFGCSPMYRQAAVKCPLQLGAGLVIIATVVKIVILLVKFHGLEIYSIPQNTCNNSTKNKMP